jgi:hypothetical protein
MKIIELIEHERDLEFREQALEDEIKFVNALMSQPIPEEQPEQTEPLEPKYGMIY